MLYQVEEIKMNKRKKLIIVYVVILLLVLSASIGLGIVASKKYSERKNEDFSSLKTTEGDINEEKPDDSVMVIVDENKNKDDAGDKKNFIKNVDNIYNGTEGKRVFLTFDDGPSGAVTPHILDTLKKYNIKATFFVLGTRVKINPELVKREYEEGHYIANHGYSHQYSKMYASSNEVIKEYTKTEKEIQKALGNKEYSSNLFRFPGGSVGGAYEKVKKQTKEELKKKDIAYLDWNALTNDSAGANTKEKIMKNLKETVGKKNNVVILMHDAPDKILTYETLEDVIKYLQDKGYAFKNMYDLM